jgi:hypothetical protein
MEAATATTVGTASATAMPSATMLREGWGRAKQRYRSNPRQKNLKEIGFCHFSSLHPTASCMQRAARANSTPLDSHQLRLVANS